MRRISWSWSIGAAAAMVGWLAVAWADESQPPSPPTARERSPLEQLVESQPAEKPHRKKPAKQSPSPNAARAATPLRGNGVTNRGNEPVAFTSKEGIKGWSIAIPGNQSSATPAVVDGKVFIGGGFASRDFGALDARTGKVLWHYVAADNGPTAPVVTSNYITFNTESCELEVLTTNGEPVWKKLLGSSLTSTPAIANGCVVVSFPSSRGDLRYGKYCLASFDLRNGKGLWQTSIADEVITAPVIDGKRVFVTTVDGSLYCFLAKNGALVWREAGVNATSAPTVWNGRCWFSRRQEIVSANGRGTAMRQTEQVAVRGLAAHDDVRGLAATTRLADYLDCRKYIVPMGAMSPPPARSAARRAAPGDAFAGGGIGQATDDSDSTEPPLPSLSNVTRQRNGGFLTAQSNLGLSGIMEVWSYQGSRPLFYKGRLYAALGDSLSCVDAKTEKVLWKKDFRPDQKDMYTIYKKYKNPTSQEETRLLYPTIAPPVLVNDKVFVGTSYGNVTCLSAATGEILWQATIDDSIVSQPVVARGRIYVTTKSGRLFCLETDDRDDHGWLMWGANAAHTGSVGEEEGSEQARRTDMLPSPLADSRD